MRIGGARGRDYRSQSEQIPCPEEKLSGGTRVDEVDLAGCGKTIGDGGTLMFRREGIMLRLSEDQTLSISALT